MAPLKVVCLISGGKDSFFSILHCLKNGHEVVALANLHPPLSEDGGVADDLDSYMYQTIGHTVIPLYEDALGLPLYRQEILGTHVNQHKSYGPANATGVENQDETEALVPLLQKVKVCHPEVNAISTGAILSDYQRTRVESVAIRLGLAPLAFLWQWPNLPSHSQSSLLEDMATVGLDARIIKVASGGLDEKFLWKNVADRRTIRLLESASKRFGSPGDGAILGEGGEYETLAIAGPAPLWKARINVDETNCTPVPSGAGAAYLRLSGARLEPNLAVTRDISDLSIPPLLDTAFKTLLDSFTIDAEHGNLPIFKQSPISDGISSSIAFPSRRQLLFGLTADGATPAHQTYAIMDKAFKLLQCCSHSFSDVAYTSIILRDMADFASINAVYGSYFNHPNPPARVTIACAAVLPEGKDVMISLTSVRSDDAAHRRGLHVQSRSYWAPANIGPYSQALSVSLESDSGVDNGSIVYIAGQIPLVPSSMELPRPQDNGDIDPFVLQTLLAMQHFMRIGHAMQVRQWACAVAFITATSPEEAVVRGDIARRAWEGFRGLHASNTDESLFDAESDSFDIWDLKFGNARQSDKPLAMSDLSIQEEYKAEFEPSFYVIKVDALPRGSSIEWVTYGLTTAYNSSPKISHLDHLLHMFRQQAIGPLK